MAKAPKQRPPDRPFVIVHMPTATVITDFKTKAKAITYCLGERQWQPLAVYDLTTDSYLDLLEDNA